MFQWRQTLVRSLVVFAYIYGINAIIYNFKFSNHVFFYTSMHCLILEYCNQMNDFTFSASFASIMIFIFLYCVMVCGLIAVLIGFLVAITQLGAWMFVVEHIFFTGIIYLLFIAELYILLKNNEARAFIWNFLLALREKRAREKESNGKMVIARKSGKRQNVQLEKK